MNCITSSLATCSKVVGAATLGASVGVAAMFAVEYFTKHTVSHSTSLSKHAIAVISAHPHAAIIVAIAAAIALFICIVICKMKQNQMPDCMKNGSLGQETSSHSLIPKNTTNSMSDVSNFDGNKDEEVELVLNQTQQQEQMINPYEKSEESTTSSSPNSMQDADQDEFIINFPVQQEGSNSPNESLDDLSMYLFLCNEQESFSFRDEEPHDEVSVNDSTSKSTTENNIFSLYSDSETIRKMKIKLEKHKSSNVS